MSDLECRMSNVIKKYHLPKNFILYFGTIEPRKNISGLIRAFELLKEKNKDFKKVYLVIAGGKGWLFKNIFAMAARSKFAKHIIFTGFVSPEDKVYLYNLADLFVYPSFFEGFGFPPLEAMACGVPTITSNTSSLPEIAQDAALMVNPYDTDELAWAMEQVLSDVALRKELARRSLAQAKLFSWDKCARETLNFLTQ
jgi:glycosyltransferase involved in cell wall biosynthesis